MTPQGLKPGVATAELMPKPQGTGGLNPVDKRQSNVNNRAS